MIKIDNESIIKGLLESDIIANANTIGRMKNQSSWEIYVDKPSDPKGYFLKDDEWYTMFFTDDNIARQIIRSIDFDNKSEFAGILKKYYDMIKEIREIEWEEPCYLYYLDKEDIDSSKIKHKVEEIKLKDATVVNEYYTYKDENSLLYLEECISRGPSSAIYDDNGELMSWSLMREDGSMGVMYTKKEHRGKGLAVSVSVDLARKVIDKGITPYVHIVTDNSPSIALAESIGFKRYGEIMWFGVK